MSLYTLATGVLHKAAEIRTSKSGNEFATCRIRVNSEDRDGAATTVWVNVIAFADESVATLQRLNQGDAVSVGGKAKILQWEKDGKQGVGIDIVAVSVAAARPKPRPRRQADDCVRQPYASRVDERRSTMT